MRFLIVTQVLHKYFGGRYYAYGPYVREMNLWLRYVDEVIIVAPLVNTRSFEPIDIAYNHTRINFLKIPQFDIISPKAILKTIIFLPKIVVSVFRGMRLADHIHLRCPGNVGLIGCIVQILFPHKRKTAKYAGNWDWNIRQPWSYRLQQRIIRNTLLTHKMTALVYGEWPDKTRNIKPFFTASYSENDKLPVSKKSINEVINLAFVGSLTKNKSPLTGIEVLKALTENGITATLTYCGEGQESIELTRKIKEYQLIDRAKLLGNVNSERVKEVLRETHFLIFISRSEGWPKAVSEAMWWGCLPITTPVSCVPQMLGNGERGDLVTGDFQQICNIIAGYRSDQPGYYKKSDNAMTWSREFTLEKFEEEIKMLILS